MSRSPMCKTELETEPRGGTWDLAQEEETQAPCREKRKSETKTQNWGDEEKNSIAGSTTFTFSVKRRGN